MDIRHSQLRIIIHYVTSLKYEYSHFKFRDVIDVGCIVTYDAVRIVQSQGLIIFAVFLREL